MFIKSRRQVNQNNRPLRKLRSASQVLLNGTPGIYYDIQNPFVSMYKTSTGEELVTAAGDSVGLVLDSRYGLIRGEDVAGTPSLNGWIDNMDGSYTHSGTTLQELRFALGELSDGDFVEVEFELTGGSLASLQAGGPGGQTVSGTATGTKRFILKANGVGTVNAVRFLSNADGVTVSNPTIKKIPGYHATQSTDGDRPVLGRKPLGVGVTNRLAELISIDSEDLTTWGQAANVAVVGNQDTSPNNVNLDLLSKTSSSSPYVFVLFAGEGPASNAITYFNASDGTFSHSSNFDSLAAELIGDGVYEVTAGHNGQFFSILVKESDMAYLRINSLDLSGDWRLDFTPSSSAGSITGDSSGTQGILVGGLHIYETESTYQHVVGQYDVTQSGIPDLWYLSGNGTNQFMTIPGSDSYLKFLHDGTNGRVIGAYSYDSEDTGSLAAFYGNRQVTGDIGSTSYVRDSGSLDARLTRYISNGSTDIVDQASADMAIPRYSPFIHDSYYGESLSPEAATLIDGQVVSSGDAVGTPSTSDADFDMALMARNGTSGVGLFFPGKLYGITFIAGASEQQASQLTQFYANEAGITL